VYAGSHGIAEMVAETKQKAAGMAPEALKMAFYLFLLILEPISQC
jgi:hypothetical protein